MRLISAEELQAAPTDALPWILEGFGVRGSAILLYGRQGIGKTSLAWQLAHSLTTGVPWLGHTILQTGKVVWLNLDMPHLEFRELLLRAGEAGMPATTDILVPDIGELDEFNILEDAGRGLAEACRAVQPLALVIDTAADAFLPQGRDINAEVRTVIRFLRRCIPHGLLVMLLHDRKRSAYQTVDANLSDLDAFLGPSAWEAKATTSFRLTHGRDSGYELRINKTRLDRPLEPIIKLDATEHGFFVAQPSILQALMLWKGGAVALKDIFDAIAMQLDKNPEAVKRAYYRATKRGVRFPWSDVTPSDRGVTLPPSVTLQVVDGQEVNRVTHDS